MAKRDSRQPGSQRYGKGSGKVIPTTATVVPTAPRKRPNLAVQAVIVVIGVILFAQSIGKLFAPEQGVRKGPLPTGAQDSAFNEDSFAIFNSGNSSNAMWQNPDTSILQKQFWSGSRTSTNCTETPAHPFVEEFDRAGWTPKEYEDYLGWSNTPTADDNRVIEDTLIFRTKSFKIFGK